MYPEICDGPDEIRKSAREALRRGADQIKVMADGGVASPSDKPGQWQYEVDELQAAVLRVKLRYLEKENIQRQNLAQR